MFKKDKKHILLYLLLTILVIPIQVLAYSDYIIASGENIGIELNSNGILIVGTYTINGLNPSKESNLQIGDKIISINDNNVSSINSMLDIINNSKDKSKIKIGYIRANKEYNTTLNLIYDNDIYKTGLYVKDSITGVGTLTFIDPNTHIFGALGHEIIEKNTGQRLDIKNGKIYSSTVTGINPSIDGNPGEKNARANEDIVYGDVLENTSYGLFGNYTDTISTTKLYKVASIDEINIGPAQILTVINDNEVNKYNINILKINKNNTRSKNILFEITDENLLSITGGIIQGMSGSPIIQDDKIIGAVTHVVVDDPTKGYGIFITNMLEEAEN